jgi:hypothetical protein
VGWGGGGLVGKENNRNTGNTVFTDSKYLC